MDVIRFPSERVRACLNPPTEPCLILILPIVRIEYDDPVAPLTDEERKAWMTDWGTF